MPLLELESSLRRALRSAAHALKPVVLVGDQGLSAAVLKEIDTALKAHGLIKVRVAGDDREARLAMIEPLSDALNCALVNHLGKTLILYRPGATKPVFDGDKPAADSGDESLGRAGSHHAKPEIYVPKKQAAAGKTKPNKKRAPVRSNRDLAPKKGAARRTGSGRAPAAGGSGFASARVGSGQVGRPTRPSTRNTQKKGASRQDAMGFVARINKRSTTQR